MEHRKDHVCDTNVNSRYSAYHKRSRRASSVDHKAYSSSLENDSPENSKTVFSGIYGLDLISCSSLPQLHFKKDGSLDMRYKSSKNVIKSQMDWKTSYPSQIRLKKDGTPDMRFHSSKEFMKQFPTIMNQESSQVKNGGSSKKQNTTSSSRTSNASSKAEARPTAIPSNMPLTKNGLPDKRTKEYKKWMEQQEQKNG